MRKTLTLNVNGESYEVTVRATRTLLDVLRDQLGLTGAKRGCDSGTCGACTVLLDGEPALACLTLAVRCGHKRIITIEALAACGALDPLQEAAIQHGAVQCGYCAPGWLLSAKALLDRNPAPSRSEIRTALAGHLCRCTGYQKIEEAILAVAARDRSRRPSRRARA